MSEKIRMTAQSKVNIQAARSADLVRADQGYKVVLTGATGKQIDVMSGDNEPAIYPSMASAKKALHRHNPTLLDVALMPEI